MKQSPDSAPVRRQRPSSALAAALLLLTVAPALAQPPGDDDASLAGLARPWLVGLGVQADEQSSESVLGTFSYGVSEKTWLSFAAGRSRSPADRAAVSADTLRADLDQRIGELGVTASLQRFGDDGALETDDVSLGGYFARDSLRVGVTFEQRDIAIPFTVTGPLGRPLARTAELDADGIALDVRFAAGPSWTLGARVAEHDYENGLAIVPRIERLNLLGASALTLAYGFTDAQRSLSAERAFGRHSLTLHAAHDRSAVDGQSYRGYEAALLIPAAGRLDVEINVGHGSADAADAGWYAGVLLLVYGGR